MLALLWACVEAPDAVTSTVIPDLRDTARPNDTGFVLETGGETPKDTGGPVPPLPGILLNEVVAKNRSTGDDGTGTFPDWIELYNPTAGPVAFDRIALHDHSGALWRGGEGELPAGGYAIVWADGIGGEALGQAHAPFALDGDGGETVVLSVDGFVVDRLAVGELGPDVAWARFPDGETWMPTIRATPNATNGVEPGTGLDPTSLVFADGVIHDIHILLSDADITALRADRLTYVEGGVTFAEGTFSDVGVRLKAYVGSSRTIDQKCGFKIDLNRYADHSWHGLKTVTLNNMVQDYTYIHEALAYQFYRAAGVPAPRTVYAHVYVNDEYYGLYLLVETIDDTFLARWYADNSGAMYEGAYGVDLFDGSEYSFDYDEGANYYDRSDLTVLINVLDEGSSDAALADLEQVADLDEMLRNMAVEALIWHWDGYTTRNNYRLYHDPVSDRFQILPWGTDQTFVNYYYDPWSNYGRLFTTCIANDACEARYNAILLELADTMEGLDLWTQASDLESGLYGDIAGDPRREFDLNTHNAYMTATQNQMTTWPAAVRVAVGNR